MSVSTAWTEYPLIEVRTGNSYPAILLDCAGRDGTAALIEAITEGLLLRPNWTRLPRIVRWYARSLDAGNAGASRRGWSTRPALIPTTAVLLSHNPYPRAQGVELRTKWGCREPYTLAELAERIPRYWRAPVVEPLTGLRRNCELFDACMKWAGSPHNRPVLVLDAALAFNAGFAQPLDSGEVKATSKSIERYRREWEAQGRFYTDEERTEYGRRCGVVLRAARLDAGGRR